METTPDNIRTVVKRLYELSFLPGYPDTTEKLKHFATAFLRIVNGKPLHYVHPDNDKTAPDGALAISIPIPPAIVTDIDWIIQQIADSCERFPAPAIIFRMYSRYLPAANEATVRQMQDTIES